LDIGSYFSGRFSLRLDCSAGIVVVPLLKAVGGGIDPLA
jgi:hypothetical protein